MSEQVSSKDCFYCRNETWDDGGPPCKYCGNAGKTDWQRIARERTADLGKADAEIERLKRDLFEANSKLGGWLEANGEGGWIDHLRKRTAPEPKSEHPPQLMAVVDKWQDNANTRRELALEADRLGRSHGSLHKSDAELIESVLRDIRRAVPPPLALPNGHDVWVRCGNVKTDDVRTVMQAVRELMAGEPVLSPSERSTPTKPAALCVHDLMAEIHTIEIDPKDSFHATCKVCKAEWRTRGGLVEQTSPGERDEQ